MNLLAVLLSLVLSFAPVAGALPEPDGPEVPAPAVSTFAGTGSHGAEDGEAANFNLPMGIFGDAGGNLYIADTYNNLIRSICQDGETARFAGGITGIDEHSFPRGLHRDGTMENALFNRPAGGVMDGQGRVFIADSGNHAIRIVVGGRVFTFAGGPGHGHANGNRNAALFNRPSAIAIGPCGGLFIADTMNHVIRRIDTDGNVTTIAGTPGRYGHRDGAAGRALFYTPMGIAVSGDGVIFVADTGNHLIRVIENGNVSTLAGTLIFPDGIDWDDPGDFDDEPLGGHADGEEAMFSLPMGLALWGDALIVADSANHMIRAILPTGETITLSGTGYPDYINGALYEAAFHLPRGVYVRGDTLYIADTGNNLIRTLCLEAALASLEYEYEGGAGQ